MLIYGSPGTGKTSAALLLSRLKDYLPLHLNASDVRNKSQLTEILDRLQGVHQGSKGSVASFLVKRHANQSTQQQQQAASTIRRPVKRVVIMDEVDGISGTEDRGGLNEIMRQIKTQCIPFICIANDGSALALKTLKKYSLTLVWKAPTPKEVLPRLVEIAQKEKIDVGRPYLQQLITSSQGDVRQCINALQWHTSSIQQAMKTQQGTFGKDYDLSLFETAERVLEGFQPEEFDQTLGQWLNSQTDLYFNDSSMMPLFVQQNYLSGHDSSAVSMDDYARAANAVCDADIVNRAILDHQEHETLMPFHAIASCALPVYYGSHTKRPTFPVWLGQYSRHEKNKRVCREMTRAFSERKQNQGRVTNTQWMTEYVIGVKTALIEPFRKNVDAHKIVTSRLIEFNLSKDMWDAMVIEVDPVFLLTRSEWSFTYGTASAWPIDQAALQLDAQSKRKFTLWYNKTTPKTEPKANIKAAVPRAGNNDDNHDDEGDDDAHTTIATAIEDDDHIGKPKSADASVIDAESVDEEKVADIVQRLESRSTDTLNSKTTAGVTSTTHVDATRTIKAPRKKTVDVSVTAEAELNKVPRKRKAVTKVNVIKS